MATIIAAIIAVIGATFTYTITKFIIDNILQQRKIISEITEDFIFYANVYSNYMNREEVYREASEKFRKLASELGANIKIIPLYSFLENLCVVHKNSNINLAIKELIGLSNGCLGLIEQRNDYVRVPDDNKDRINEIKKLLDISFPE